MRATNFEVRYRLFLHQFLVLAAFLTYFVDRDDIVWRFIKTSTGNVRMMERAIFVVATILFGVAAWLCTHSRALGRPRASYIGEFLYVVALGSLAPLAGFVILVVGEAIRLLRLAMRQDAFDHREPISWLEAFQLEAVKWGFFFTLIVFSITLIDRVAELLAGATVLIWILLNACRVAKNRT